MQEGQQDYFQGLLEQNSLRSVQLLVDQSEGRVYNLIHYCKVEVSASCGPYFPHDKIEIDKPVSAAPKDEKPVSPLDIKALSKARQERERRLQLRREKHQSQLQQLVEKEMQARLEEEIKKKQTKKQQLEEGIRRIRERQLKRRQEEERSQAKIKELAAKKSRHEEINERYVERVVLPQLQHRKRKVEQLREQSRPIDREALLQHIKHYEELKSKHENQRREQKQIQQFSYRPPAASLWLKLVNEQDSQKAAELQAQRKRQEENRERRAEFAREVKSKVRVNASSNLQTSRSEAESKKRVLSISEMREVGNRNMEVAKSLADKNRFFKEDLDSSFSARQKPTDYMHHYDSEAISKAKLKELDRVKSSSMKDEEKMDRLKKQASLLDKEAEARGKVLSLKDDPRVREEVAHLLLQSIRAKKHIIDLNEPVVV